MVCLGRAGTVLTRSMLDAHGVAAAAAPDYAPPFVSSGVLLPVSI